MIDSSKLTNKNEKEAEEDSGEESLTMLQLDGQDIAPPPGWKGVPLESNTEAVNATREQFASIEAAGLLTTNTGKQCYIYELCLCTRARACVCACVRVYVCCIRHKSIEFVCFNPFVCFLFATFFQNNSCNRMCRCIDVDRCRRCNECV